VVRDASGKASYHTTRDLPGAGAGALMGGLWAGRSAKDDLDQAFGQQINDSSPESEPALQEALRGSAAS
jgi:hypothetical protein